MDLGVDIDVYVGIDIDVAIIADIHIMYIYTHADIQQMTL